MKIAVLTSEESWFVPYAKEFIKSLQKRNKENKMFYDHKKISEDYKIVFILSYFKIIEKKFLLKHKYNIVVHESDLPKGKGWAPLFWQILENKKKIPVVLFDASECIDDGNIYIKDYITLNGHELNNEIREKQAKKTIELCLKFINNYNNLKPKKQKGNITYYKKRKQNDSEIDINKTIKEQFNLFRISNNDRFPIFFYYKNHKYILKIYKEK